jgi:hypothetical protein
LLTAAASAVHITALMAMPEKPGSQKVADEDLPLPADAPKAPTTERTHLKGGVGRPSDGEKFGLNW